MTTQRSPNYPRFDLEEAVTLVNKLYQSEGRAPFTAESVALAWEYNSPSGPVRSRIGALRQYGLITKGGRESQLTDRAFTLVLRNAASREHQEALRSAALTPTLFREIHEARRDASDDNLKHYLIVERNFTPEGAERCIKSFRGTMNVAGLLEDGKLSGTDHDEFFDENEEDHVVAEDSQLKTIGHLSSSVPEGSIAIPVPLDSDRMATVNVPIDMQESDWKRLERILEAYKPQR